MLISCGAALYGLRLAVRTLGYVPEVDILHGPAGRRPLARVRLGPAAPMTAEERAMLAAVPRRHTHRGPFEAGPLPAGLLARLRADVRAEGATRPRSSRSGTPAADGPARGLRRSQDRDPRSRYKGRGTEMEQRGRMPGPGRRARACLPRPPQPRVGTAPQRDFHLGRGLGQLRPAVRPRRCRPGVTVHLAETATSTRRTGPASVTGSTAERGQPKKGARQPRFPAAERSPRPRREPRTAWRCRHAGRRCCWPSAYTAVRHRTLTGRRPASTIIVLQWPLSGSAGSGAPGRSETAAPGARMVQGEGPLASPVVSLVSAGPPGAGPS